MIRLERLEAAVEQSADAAERRNYQTMKLADTSVEVPAGRGLWDFEVDPENASYKLLMHKSDNSKARLQLVFRSK